MNSVSIRSTGQQVLLIVEINGSRVAVGLSRERLLAIGDASVHVATGLVTKALVQVPEARWLNDGDKEVL